MRDTDILIIGAGICGLFAALKLSEEGKRVVLLEARDSHGGRIRQISGVFSWKADAGAEFIHGDLRLTKELLKKAGGRIKNQKGRFYRSKAGRIIESEDMMPGWDRVIRELRSLRKDMPLTEFLSTHFNEEEKELKEAVIRLAEGFDAADASRLSTFAVRDEWSGGSIPESSFIEGGYVLLTDYLVAECKKQDCGFYFNTEVSAIDYQGEQVLVFSADGRVFRAAQVIVTVSVGMLLSREGEKGHIRFIPGIPEKIKRMEQMGFGTVIKVHLEFKTVFWNDPAYAEKIPQLPHMGFLTSEAAFQVWWAQDAEEPFLTGWAGGSRAERMKDLPEEELLEKAIISLASALWIKESLLRELVLAHAVSNWARDPFTRGAYSYETPQTKEAKKILKEPLEEKIFFAGEALGKNTGTVEAALESAEEIAGRIRNGGKY